MLFNSSQFLVFFSVVTITYFLIPHQVRWFLLLLASCIFYMAFIPAYLLILIFTICIDYIAGIAIEEVSGPWKKTFLIVSIASNCGVLFLFKYFDFFNSNLHSLAHFLHWNYSVGFLQMVLPIGLSFHTFQAMSYTIEIYRKTIKPERHLGIFALYVMFYPQLVAGPIERPYRLLPQLRRKHDFDYQRVADGLKLMTWGLFKKVVIADRLAVFVNRVFVNPSSSPPLHSYCCRNIFCVSNLL